MLNIFFDLDGTLLDSQSGIIQSLQHALTETAGIEPTSDELRGFIGSSLPHILSNFLGPHGEVAEAINHYREFYQEEAMFDAEVYDGVFEMFDTFLASEVGLYIATSKPHAYANQIAQHFGLTDAVTHVFGSELDGTNSDKTALLQYALDETGFDPAKCVMVGDRQMDIFGAKNNDINNIGVLWGYGEADELRLSEADMLAGHPEELPEITFDMMGMDAE
jgi:phosphoglycolate phosphatase